MGVASVKASRAAVVVVAACGRIGFEPAGGVDRDPDAGTIDGLPPDACVQELYVAHDHSCARINTGQVLCWGRGDDGSLGDGGTTDRDVPGPSAAAAGAVRFSIGGRHGCAVTATGVVCWGSNAQAQMQLPSLVGVDQLAVGSRHTCAATAAGDATCWGCSDYNLAATDNCAGTTARQDHALGPLLALSSRHWHACAILAGDGSVRCWGANSNGELGDGTRTTSAAPVRAGTITGASQISTGRFRTCAVVGDQLFTWGDNEHGAIGDGTTNDRLSPVPVATGVRQCSTGGLHTCVVTTGGTVRCTGDNGRGQIGDGTTAQRHALVDVVGLPPGILGVETGARHTCARTLDEIWCWGRDTHGQLGNGVPGGDQPMPQRVLLPCRG